MDTKEVVKIVTALLSGAAIALGIEHRKAVAKKVPWFGKKN
jgi:hypothetical protein